MAARQDLRPSVEGLLTEAGHLLASTLDLDETLRNVARLAVPELADWAAVDVLEPGGLVRRLSSGHPDPAEEQRFVALCERHGAAEGQPSVVALEGVSSLVVPLAAAGRPVGALTLISTDPERVYDERDLPVALELADRCAQAVRNAQAYAAAESSLALLDTLIETAPVGMAFIDPDLRFVLVNRHLARINGLPVDEHVGRTLPEVLGSESEAALNVARVLRTGIAVQDREVVDEGRAFLSSFAPVAGDGRVLGVVCAVVETTERHRAAAAVARSEARYRALAEAGVIGVIRGRGGTVLEANDAFLRMVGRTREEVIFGNLSWPDLTPAKWHAADDAKYAELLATGAMTPFEKEYLHRDGSLVPVLIGATSLPDSPYDWISFVVDLTERREAERERERLLDRTERLQAISEQLSAALTEDEVAGVIVHAAMAATGACCGVLGLRVEDRALSIEHRFGMAEGAPSELPLDLDAPMPLATREARPVLLASRDEWLAAFPAFPPRGDFEGFAAVPLLFEGGVTGCMGLGFPGEGGFDDADVAMLVAIARQGAQALERARLYEERAYVARTLQAGLLPRALPDIPGLEIAVSYRPVGDGSEVGGDFYDLFATGEAEWMVAIGDVCGKGTQSAVMTGVVRSTIRALALADVTAGPAEVLEGVNAALLREDAIGSLATACCGVLRPDGDGCVVTLSAGGHPPPLVLRAGGEVEETPTGGRMLGVGPAPGLETAEVRLGPGDLLLLYTDGILDARAGAGAFGERRLRETLAGAGGASAAGVLAIVDGAVSAFAPGPPLDDKALMALRVPAA